VSEFAEVRAEDVVLLPMSTLPPRLEELPRDRELLFICRSGSRSGQVVAYLQANGRQDVANVAGGMLAWEIAGLPVRRGSPEPNEGDPTQQR
jgi:rhodanese-related sulfurtransferase